MSKTLVLSGAEKLISQLEDISGDIEAALSAAVEATGLELRTDIIRRYNSGPASGRVYHKKNPERIHRASAPGQAPMTDLGDLAKNTLYTSVSPLTVTVSNRLPRAEWLEYGTRNIAPRPAWVPAMEKAAPRFAKRIERAVNETMK